MSRKQKVRAIMLDWAGTTVDHGSVAPVLALQSLFARHGIALFARQARKDMGLLKRDHIRAILGYEEVAAGWREIKGRPAGEADVTALFEEFGPLQMEVIVERSQLIAGAGETVEEWQRCGIRIGSSTGYTRAMLAPVLAQAALAGYRPDASVCPDEVAAGRPAPWMLWRNAEMLDVYPPNCCVKIGDTISDIEEGRNAGMWTIGLTRTGNMIGLNAADWERLPELEKQERLGAAEAQFHAAGADFVAEDLHGCREFIRQLDERLER